MTPPHYSRLRPILFLHAFYFSSHSRFLFSRSIIPIRGHEAHRPENTKPVPSGSGSAPKGKMSVPSGSEDALVVGGPFRRVGSRAPLGSGPGTFPGGSLHRRVERPSTKKRSGTRNTGAVQRRRQRPGPRPRVLPTHQKGTIHLVGAPQELPSRWLRPVRSGLTRNWGPHGEPPSYLTLPGGRKEGRGCRRVPGRNLSRGY